MVIELTSTRFAQGLHFGEGPRIRDGQLWCSDMHAQRVVRFDAAGRMETVLEVANDPSGLGWLPNGDLLVVSMRDRRLLRWNGSATTVHADLFDLAAWHCNDMVVDAAGRAYVGNFGFDLPGGARPTTTNLICVEADGAARTVADELMFPNGTVITPDGSTLIVAESFASRLTAFDIGADGALTNRRLWASMPGGAVPDGICLDEDGGVWVASPTTNDCLRVLEGGEVSHRVAFDRGAFACILNGRELYTLTCADSRPDFCRAQQTGCVEVAEAPSAAAGWP